jgi:hypothetical protein
MSADGVKDRPFPAKKFKFPAIKWEFGANLDPLLTVCNQRHKTSFLCCYGGVPFHRSVNSSKRQFIEWPFHQMHKLI